MSYLKLGLTVEAGSSICIERCRAQCCQGPLVLRLSEEEKLIFQQKADGMGTTLKITLLGQSWILKFQDHQGGRCPMLDSGTSICRIYNDRPSRCRLFPGKPIPGCAISGN